VVTSTTSKTATHAVCESTVEDAVHGASMEGLITAFATRADAFEIAFNDRRCDGRD